MFDKETLKALQEAKAIAEARESVELAENNPVALPSDYRLHDLEPFNAHRRRARGAMRTAVIDAFAAYTVTHAEDGCTIFIDPDAMRAQAVLNLGTPAYPGHTDNQAELRPKQTPSYAALLAVANGSGHKQSVVAEFLEDWADCIACFSQGDASISITKAIAAVRRVSIEAIRRAETSVEQLSESQTAFESARASSTEAIPTRILFTCTPYADLEKRAFELRLGVLTGSDKPLLVLRIVKATQHDKAMAEELGQKIIASFEGKEFPVVLGTYSKAG